MKPKKIICIPRRNYLLSCGVNPDLYNPVLVDRQSIGVYSNDRLQSMCCDDDSFLLYSSTQLLLISSLSHPDDARNQDI